MNGQIDSAGRVTITFESQAGVLLAPDGKKYLPCYKCGNIVVTPMNVVSTLCPPCDAWEKSDDEGWICMKCDLHWPWHVTKCKCGMDRDEPKFPDGGPCKAEGCDGRYTFCHGCGAYVCDECDDHKGLCRCYCGWAKSGRNGLRELIEIGETIDPD